MRSVSAARSDDAIRALQWMIGWAGGWMPVRYRGPRTTTCWYTPRAELADHVRRVDEQWDQEVAFGLPQSKRFNGGVGQATVLWCRIEGADQEARARRFHPRPSLVLQEGSTSRRWLLWALTEAASYFQVVPANRKLAYALRATQKHGDPDGLWLPAPGTFLRHERTRPVPIVVGRLTTDAYSVDGVVGRLREPPPKDAWMAAAR